ncbi:ABC transporter, ATP-binding protein [Streptococcus ictaluri 707-05]|uniref:ABC transporter, ATP-binding protein n=1 Tax=Streptococcus ictaluri 707-05 TaxID=764299 RepID=G5K1R2_9STRE|nr:ABC transporter, ATP-binding protein [Streptococcus ictaluri 707-05]
MTLKGDIHYQGINLRQLTSKEWQKIRGRRIAYLVQNPMAMFNPFQKIGSHVLETTLSHEQKSKKACLTQVLDWMQRLGLQDADALFKKYPFELSGGMLQRVMLAIILCLDPQMIILDEPTSALDCHNCSNLFTILKELQDRGKTLITVTHDFQLAQALGGQLMVINKGHIVEQGLTEAVFSQPKEAYTKSLLNQSRIWGEISYASL